MQKKLIKLILACLISLCFVQLSYSSELVAINNFNVKEYLGTWYELARMPNSFEDNCITPITANYSVNPDNNKQIIVVNQCNTRKDGANIATGVADFVATENIGKLKVNFLPKWLRWIPFTSGDYWVLNVNYTGIAIVGSPDHKYLWILSRSVNVKPQELNDAVNFAKLQGFDTSELIFNY